MTDKEKIQQLIRTNNKENITLAFQPLKSQGISSLDLRDANLDGADLSGINFKNAILNGAKLMKADLSGHDLSSDIFKDAIDIEKQCYLLCLPIHKQLRQLHTHNYWVILASQQSHPIKKTHIILIVGGMVSE